MDKMDYNPLHPRDSKRNNGWNRSNLQSLLWRSCWITVQREIQSIAIYLGCFLFCCAMRVEVINNNSPTMHWSLCYVAESLMVAYSAFELSSCVLSTKGL
jgi:hypothetical protein